MTVLDLLTHYFDEVEMAFLKKKIEVHSSIFTYNIMPIFSAV